MADDEFNDGADADKDVGVVNVSFVVNHDVRVRNNTLRLFF